MFVRLLCGGAVNLIARYFRLQITGLSLELEIIFSQSDKWLQHAKVKMICHRWRRMVQYLHDSVHTNVLKFSHTCQLTVLNFSGILHWFHRLPSPLHIRPKLCCVVAVVLDIQCGEERIFFLLHTEYPIKLQQHNTIWA